MRTNDGLEKFLRISQEIIWLTIIALVPLCFSLDIFNHWQMAKNIVFQSLVEIMFFLFLGQIIIFGVSFDEIKKRIKFVIPTLSFIVVLGISTIFSEVRWFSFWGSWQRKLGFLAWAHFFAFFLVLVFNLRNKAQFKRIVLTVLITASLVAFYGFLQFFGYDPFNWVLEPVFRAFDYRVFSSLGQPNFLASWLLLVIPLNFLAIFLYKRRFSRFFLGLLLLVLIFLFVLTQSRGGFIGFMLEAAFLGLAFSYFKNKKAVFFSIIFVLILGILTVGWLNIHNLKRNNSDFTQFGGPIGRIQSLANLENVGKYRLLHWQASLDIIKDRPFIGFGLGSQRFHFPYYYGKEFAMYEKPNIFLDRAHNNTLDVLLSAGILGLIAWWFFLGLIFYWGFKTGARQRTKIVFLLAGIFGYFISIQFSFHTHSPLLYFWLFVALIISMKYIQKPSSQQALLIPSCPVISKRLSIAIIFLLVILAVFTVWFINGCQYLASHYLLKAEIAKAEGNFSSAYNFHIKAIEYGRKDPYFRQMFGKDMLEISSYETNPLKKLLLIQQGIKQIEDIPPHLRPIEARIYLPQLLTEKAKLTNNMADFQKADYYFEDLIKFSPNLALSWRNWAELDIARKDWNSARKKLEHSLDLCPDPYNPRTEHPREVIEEIVSGKEKLARIEFEAKNYDKSLKIYQEILKLDPKQIYVWQRIGEIYEIQGNADKAAKAKMEFQKRLNKNLIQKR